MPSAQTTPPFSPYVIITGAGPSGLLLTLLLARLSSIPVLLLDTSPTLDTNPRATHYGPPAMVQLRRAGLIPDMLKRGFVPDTICWRKLSGERIAGIGSGTSGIDGKEEVEAGVDRIVCLPLNQLGGIMVRHLREYEEKGLVRVEWGTRVVDAGQDEGGEKAWVEVERADGARERLEAPYVVGCDGGNSTVRRCLFGKEFPGKTWEEQIVATNVSYLSYPVLILLK
jgi:2-polyprenyl-6-methoxyphenol hydroxylase-like FAD-dependent oxidoreductase